MIGNFSRSIQSIETLILTLSYFAGFSMIFVGLLKLKNKAASMSHSQEPNHVAFAFIAGGALVFFLPASIQVASNTAFGTNNVLQYATYNPWNIYESLGVIIQASGLYWFLRGCILVVHGSMPGKHEGRKGFFYLCAGVLALNFTLTTSVVNYLVESIMQLNIFTKK